MEDLSRQQIEGSVGDSGEWKSRRYTYVDGGGETASRRDSRGKRWVVAGTSHRRRTDGA